MSTTIFLRWMSLSTLVLILDQITKYWVDNSLVLGQEIPIIPMFSFTLAYNPGAAFSFLSDAGGWQRWFFIVLSSVISVVLVVWIKRLADHEKLLAAALSLIAGGAVGNLVDRIIYGHVVDFILLYYETHRFPPLMSRILRFRLALCS